LVQRYIHSVLREQGYEFCFFEDFEILLAFALGFFTDFEILGVFQRTGLCLYRKKQTKFVFFQLEKLDPQNAFYEPRIDIRHKSLLL